MDNLVAAMLFFLITAITPGPNNFMIMSSAVNYGVYKSVPHLLGIILGFPIMLIGVGLGLNALFKQFYWLYQPIKILGIIYIFYLAYKIATTTNKSTKSRASKPFTFMQALLFQWINPKALIVITSGISIYTTIENIQTQIFILAAINLPISVISTTTWLFLGVGMQKILSNKRRIIIFNQIMAILLIVSILPVIRL